MKPRNDDSGLQDVSSDVFQFTENDLKDQYQSGYLANLALNEMGRFDAKELQSSVVPLLKVSAEESMNMTDENDNEKGDDSSLAFYLSPSSSQATSRASNQRNTVSLSEDQISSPTPNNSPGMPPDSEKGVTDLRELQGLLESGKIKNIE